jgi:spermidine/putrescine transport system permease protein
MKRRGVKTPRRRVLGRRTAIIACLPMYLFTLVFVLGPLVYMLVLSFQDSSGGFSFASYPKILQPIYITTIINSVKLALVSTLIVVLLGYPFGYFMSKLSAKWRGVAMLLLIIPFWTSALLRLYGWMTVFRANGLLDKLLMWLHITKKPLKLLYSYPAVVVGMVYVLLPFMIYSVYSSAEKLDRRLVEASRDLGASRARAFLTVTLPLTSPGLMSGVILTFVPSMGLYFIADILGGNKIVLVGNVIYEVSTRGNDRPFAAALSLVLLVVTTLFLFIYRRVTHADLEGLV